MSLWKPIVMLSKAKHLADTAMNYGEMLHSVQHDMDIPQTASPILSLLQAKNQVRICQQKKF